MVSDPRLDLAALLQSNIENSKPKKKDLATPSNICQEDDEHVWVSGEQEDYHEQNHLPLKED